MSDESMKALHTRFARGQALTPEELAQLEAWYARQDAVEAALLTSVSDSSVIRALHAQIQQTISEMAASGQRLQAIMQQNEQLIRENARLQEILGLHLTDQAA